MSLSVPCRKAVISQGFNDDHLAWDVITKEKSGLRYGTPLCAPERVKIIRIVGDEFTPGVTNNLKRGYGIFMQGTETGLFHQYWHTLPVLPVSIGDVVERGKIVAFMGNAGTVRVAGEYVPVGERLYQEKPGTHLHWEIYNSYNPVTRKKGKHIDPKTLVDMTLLPTYTTVDILKATAIVLGKISGMLK